jgi:O-antigen biosynthesis protein
MSDRTPTDPRSIRVAVVEAGPLMAERHAGARAMIDFLRGLETLGHQPALFLESETQVVEKVTEFRPAVVVLSRPAVMIRHAPRFHELGVPLIYFGHDLHFQRLAQEGAILPSSSPVQSRIMGRLEARCWEMADVSVYPDPAEADYVCARLGNDRARYFPYYWIGDMGPGHVDAENQDLFFVGGGTHGPNRDGIGWFLADIWPQVSTDRPALRLHVCGRWEPEHVPDTVPCNVVFHGPVEEQQMLALMEHSVLAVAPLRYGAGVKRKIVQYLAGGIPTITTPVGAQGIGRTPDGTDPFLVATTSEQWVEGINRLLIDAPLRQRLSTAGRAVVDATYSTPVFLGATTELLQAAQAAVRQ